MYESSGVSHYAAPSRIPCKACSRRMTFFDSRAQYGRLRRKGLDHDQAKAILPLCQKCLTAAFKAGAIGQPQTS